MKKNILLGAFLCLIASVSWGVMFPIANDAFQHIDPFYFSVIRYVSVTIILSVILFMREGKAAFKFEGKVVPLLFFGTMAFTVYNLLIFYGQNLLGERGVMIASINEALMPMISIIILWIVYRNRPYNFTLISVAVGFIGVTLVITKGDIGQFLAATNDFFPSILILIAVIGWVIYTMGGERFAGWSALRYSTLSCMLGTLPSVIIVAILTMTGYVSVPTTEVLSAVAPHTIFMVIFPGVIALVGWNVGVSILSPLNGLLFINFVPVTTLIVSYFQGYELTTFDLVGTILIIVALVSNNIFLRSMEKKKISEKEYPGKLQEEVC